MGTAEGISEVAAEGFAALVEDRHRGLAVIGEIADAGDLDQRRRVHQVTKIDQVGARRQATVSEGYGGFRFGFSWHGQTPHR